MKWQLLAGTIVAAALVVLGLLAFSSGDGGGFDAAAAQRAARNWTGFEATDPPRREGDGWEVDVRRPNGSVVEVNLGPELQLLELDEELGPGGGPAHDEVRGERRAQAVAVVRAAGHDGDVRSVEQERDGTVEVDLVRPDETVLEVDLDARMRIRGSAGEAIGDE